MKKKQPEFVGITVEIKPDELRHCKSPMLYQIAIVERLIQAGIPNNGALSWQNVTHGKITRQLLPNGNLHFVWSSTVEK